MLGELELVASLDAATRGPRVVPTGGAVRRGRRGIRYRAEGDLELALGLDGSAYFTDELQREEEELLLII